MREPTLSCPFSRLNPSARLLQSSSRGLPFPSSHRIPFLSSQPHTSHLVELSHPPRNQEPRTHPCPDFPNPFSTACLVEDSFAVGPAVKSLDVTAPHPFVPPARLFRPTFPSPLAPRPSPPPHPRLSAPPHSAPANSTQAQHATPDTRAPYPPAIQKSLVIPKPEGPDSHRLYYPPSQPPHHPRLNQPPLPGRPLASNAVTQPKPAHKWRPPLADAQSIPNGA